MSLERIINARIAAHARRKTAGFRISPAERDRILDLLSKLPLPEVRDRTGRAYATLAKIANDAGL